MVQIRKLEIADIDSYLELGKKIEQETEFMLAEAGERQPDNAARERLIQNFIENDNNLLLVAEDQGELVGFIIARWNGFRKRRHERHIIIGILQNHSGKGLGTQLMKQTIEWAISKELHRLELTVLCHNERAVKLYKRMGFEIEGRKLRSIFMHGEYFDEYSMAKPLTP